MSGEAGPGMEGSKKHISGEEWERRMLGSSVRKADMNRLVMDFLVTEGHVEAARRFQLESGTSRTAASPFLSSLPFLAADGPCIPSPILALTGAQYSSRHCKQAERTVNRRGYAQVHPSSSGTRQALSSPRNNQCPVFLYPVRLTLWYPPSSLPGSPHGPGHHH